MAYYKVNFYTRPNIERFPDNPPSISSSYYIDSNDTPDKSRLEDWYYNNIGGAQGYKVVFMDVVEVPEEEYEKQHYVYLIKV
jgi:hypothetical protein